MKPKPRLFVVKPIYRVTELARMVGMSRFAMWRMLKRNGVEVAKARRGEPGMVTLVALRVGMPDLWESILLARALSNSESG